MAKRKVGSQTASLTPNQEKSGIDSIFLALDNVPHTVGKFSTRTTTFFRLHLDPRSACKVMGIQSCGSPPLAQFRDSHSRVSGEKNHLDVGFVASHRVHYKGEGGGFPQVRAVVSLVCPCYPWLILAPRVLQLCTNHLVWVMRRPV